MQETTVSSTARRPRRPRRGDIQGLRALAVGLVILGHFGFSAFEGGFVGVDVFFVLSGFLITGLLVAEGERTGRVSIADFYARRARRILPAATVALLAILVWTVLREPTSRLSPVADDSLWSAIFLGNWHFAQIGTDYFADEGVSPVRHYWSLSVEEQFYVVWPVLLLVLLLLKARRRVVFATMLALTLASAGYAIWLTNTSPVSAYFSTPARAYELGVGALLALAVPRLQALADHWRHVLAWLGLAAIGYAAFFFNESTPFPGWHAWVPVLGTAALIAAGTGREVGLSRVMGKQPLHYLGDLSFSLYLWHWPVVVYGQPRVEGLGGTFLLIAITLVLSMASYHWVEQPFQKGVVPRLTGRRYLVLWPLSLALVWGAIVGTGQWRDHQVAQAKEASAEFYAKNPEAMASPSAKNVPKALLQAVQLADEDAPIPAELRNLADLPSERWDAPQRCYAREQESSHELCPMGDTDSEHVVVLLGDSHAGMWVPGMQQVAKRQSFQLIPMMKTGCVPYDVPQLDYDKPFPSCVEYREWALDQVAQLKPDVVLMAHRANWQIDADSPEEEEQLWSEGVQRTIKEIKKSVPVVKVIGDIPIIPWAPADCLSMAGATLSDCVLSPPRDEDKALNLVTGEAAEKVDADFVGVMDLICWQDQCPLVVGDVVTFRDTAHISKTWVRTIAPMLAERLDLPAVWGNSTA